jgi:sec-independent protein translocase protein TatA
MIKAMFLLIPLFIGTTELLLIGGVALLLFGGKKLPEMMRGLGKGVKEFKEGMKETSTEEDNNSSAENSSDMNTPEVNQENTK